MSKLLKKLSRTTWIKYADIHREEIRNTLRDNKDKFDASFVNDLTTRRRFLVDSEQKYTLITRTIIVIAAMAYLKFDFTFTYNGISIKNFAAFVPYAFIIYMYCYISMFLCNIERTYMETITTEWCKLQFGSPVPNSPKGIALSLYINRYLSNEIHVPLHSTFKSKKRLIGDLLIGVAPITPAALGVAAIFTGMLAIVCTEILLEFLLLYNSYTISEGLLSIVVTPLCIVKIASSAYYWFIHAIPLPYRDIAAINRLISLDDKYPDDTLRILRQVETEFQINKD